MPVARDDLERHLDEVLDSARFADYGPNGIQVEGRARIEHLATAATASLAVCTAAVAAGADALLVHHGLFWGGEQRVRGMLRNRLAALIGGDCTLFAYHLPLDAHAELGNNAVALQLLGLEDGGAFGEQRGVALGRWGAAPEPLSPADLAERCRAAFGHDVRHCPGGTGGIRRVGVVTGGGQGFLAAAAAAGLDALVTGEGSERTWHEAAELGCHCFVCGHHATEAIAVHRLGDALAERFGLRHSVIPEQNPL